MTKENPLQVLNPLQDLVDRTLADTVKKTTIQVKGKTYKLALNVEDVPMGYKVWNVGRQHFPLPGFIPVCAVNNYDCNIKPETLTALYVGSEERALQLMHIAICEKDFDMLDLMKGNI